MSDFGKTIRLGITLETLKQNKLTIETLFDVLKELPKDSIIKNLIKEWGKDTLYLEIFNDKFPENTERFNEHMATVEIIVNKLKPIWPPMIKEFIESNVNKQDFDIWDNESPAVLSDIIKNAAFKWRSGQCDHDWYATGRFSAIKHCKSCNAVAENEEAR